MAGCLFRKAAFPAVLAAMAVLFYSPGARAEKCAAEPEGHQAPRAAKLVKQAKQALSAGRFSDALSLFERAYCIYPTTILKHGISSAELNLGRCDDAVRDARFWLDHAGGEEIGEARDWLTDVLGQCVDVTLKTNVELSSIVIDGSITVVTPWTGRLRAGTHTLAASGVGMLSVETRIEVPPGERTKPLAFGIVLQPALALPPIEEPTPAPKAVPPPAAPAPALPPAVVATPNPAPPAATAPQRNNGAFVATWVVLGVGVVSAVLGASFGASANTCPTHVDTPVGLKGALQCQSNWDTASNVSWAIAGASAITAGGLALSWALPHKSSEQQQKVSVSLNPANAGLALNF